MLVYEGDLELFFCRKTIGSGLVNAYFCSST